MSINFDEPESTEEPETNEHLEEYFKAAFPHYNPDHPDFDDYWEQYANQWEMQQITAYAMRQLKAHGINATGLFRNEDQVWSLFDHVNNGFWN